MPALSRRWRCNERCVVSAGYVTERLSNSSACVDEPPRPVLLTIAQASHRASAKSSRRSSRVSGRAGARGADQLHGSVRVEEDVHVDPVVPPPPVAEDGELTRRGGDCRRNSERENDGAPREP